MGGPASRGTNFEFQADPDQARGMDFKIDRVVYKQREVFIKLTNGVRDDKIIIVTTKMIQDTRHSNKMQLQQTKGVHKDKIIAPTAVDRTTNPSDPLSSKLASNTQQITIFCVASLSLRIPLIQEDVIKFCKECEAQNSFCLQSRDIKFCI